MHHKTFQDNRPRRPIGSALLLVVLCALCVGQTGCVQRRMTIRSNPPGALVYVDDYPIGTTPITTSFIYYGQRRIRLVKDGYETLTVVQPVRPPWYEIPPVDFIAENFVPGEIRDQRTFSYQLTPQAIVPTDRLLSRAEDMRRGIVPIGFSESASPPNPALLGIPAPNPAPYGTLPATPAPHGVPARAPESIATPPGIGGQPLYPLPLSGR